MATGERIGGTVVVIGGGYTGAAFAAALLECESFAGRIVVVEPRARLGRGLAYGDAQSGEILNTRVRDMSISAASPGDFMRWIDETGATLPMQRGVRDRGGVFAPRALFGDYVEARLAARRAARPFVEVEHLRASAQAVSLADGGRTRVELDSAPALLADAAVLATGFGAPNRPCRFGVAPFTNFMPDAEMKRVVLVGSSLTMVDVLLRLRRNGYRGRIDVVSRRGLLPLPQSIETTGKVRTFPHAPQPKLSLLTQLLRREALAESASGGDWRDAVNGFRPHAPAHWRALSPQARRRFYRHARPWWDAHRHRLPLDQHQRVLRELIGGETTLSSGAAERVDGALVIRRRRRGTRVDGASIDCSGHRPDLSAPVLSSLISAGLARVDDVGVGLDVEADGAVRGGDAARIVYALGPIGAGSLVEITATPEIMTQSSAAARAILRRLAQKR